MANSDDASLDAMLKDAMIATDKEIFSGAFGQDDLDHDETGDRSLEAMGSGLEGQIEPDEDEETGEQEQGEEGQEAKSDDAEAKTEGETKVEPEAKAEDRQDERGRVPAGRLREQTERTRAVEAERDAFKTKVDTLQADFDRKLAENNARVEAILATLKAQQAPKPAEAAKPEVAPDLFENPTAFAEHINKQVEARFAAMDQQMREQRINMSMETARSRHGEAFDTAFAALRRLDPQVPDNRAIVQRLTSAPNPGEALVTWHKRNETLREVGDDPTSYKARIAEETRKTLASDPEFRKQLIAELRGEAQVGDQGKPRTVIQLPPSLQRAAGSNGRSPDDLSGLDGSEQAIFNREFAT